MYDNVPSSNPVSDGIVDPYVTLEVNPNSNDSEIKENYRRLINHWHPDKCPVLGASERFQEIKKAYELLSDPEWRKQYDRKQQQKVGTIAEVVNLSEFDFDLDKEDGEAYYSKKCRCGGSHQIYQQDIDDGYNTVECSNCSISIIIGDTLVNK